MFPISEYVFIASLRLSNTWIASAYFPFLKSSVALKN
jgi:hypothetical protein